MKAQDYKQIPTLTDTLAEPGTFIKSGDFSTYLDILRINHLGETRWVEVEVTGDFDGIDEAAEVPTSTIVATGLEIVGDAQIVLSPEEIATVEAGDWYDWQQECINADEDARADAREMEREFISDARSRGWAK